MLTINNARGNYAGFSRTIEILILILIRFVNSGIGKILTTYLYVLIDAFTLRRQKKKTFKALMSFNRFGKKRGAIKVSKESETLWRGSS